MIKVYKQAIYLKDGREVIEDTPENKNKIQSVAGNVTADQAKKATMTAQILMTHHAQNTAAAEGLPSELRLDFDALASHDITYVNIVQTAKASGLDEFPVPYVFTNCHNSLCAVGGTINEDDHLFGLSAAKRYGGIYVPPHLAVIHSYVRETLAAPGKMILGSDSHTRYGSLGTLGVGEGGGELVKQLLRQGYDVPYPKVIAVYLTGKLKHGVGPQDAALAIINAVFKDGFVKNAALEFVGEGIAGLSADFRAGIDIMTTETACWSSVWETDDTIKQYLKIHNRETEYKKISPGSLAYYDGLIHVDLSLIKPMIALPFHPSNVYTIETLLENPGDIFYQTEKDASGMIENPDVRLNLLGNIDGKRVRIDQGIVAGCAGGTFDNIMAVSSILNKRSGPGGGGNEGFSLSVYPGSQPVLLEMANNGAMGSLIGNGAIVRSAFCGPCFGAGDVPANNGLSIRHTTRNFPNREGSRPNDGQIASVCLMDSRSIAATALNNGYLASAENSDYAEKIIPYVFNAAPYKTRVYDGTKRPQKNTELRFGPNIVDWPAMANLGNNLLLKIVSYITDPVTTTDELIPSGETSSFRSNPVGLAEFTLSRKDPSYVSKAKAVRVAANALQSGSGTDNSNFKDLPELTSVMSVIKEIIGREFQNDEMQFGSAIFAKKPGDGSAREQAASCQRVLGGLANFANEYATKRYRSNLINWGILPFIIDDESLFNNGDYVFIPGIAKKVKESAGSFDAYVIKNGKSAPFVLKTPVMNAAEKDLILAGSLINYYRLFPGRG